MARPRKFDESTVLAAARDQFWEHGFAGTNMDAIAAATGLGKGSLYGAFGSKQELFHRVFEDYCASIVSGAAHHLSGGDEHALERLAAYFRAVAIGSGGPSRRGCLLAKGTAERAEHDPAVLARSHETLEQVQQFIAAEIEAGQRHGDIAAEADAQQLAALLLAVHRGIEALGKAGSNKDALLSIAETALAGLPRPSGPA